MLCSCYSPDALTEAVAISNRAKMVVASLTMKLCYNVSRARVQGFLL
jgi:hypothetical protein